MNWTCRVSDKAADGRSDIGDVLGEPCYLWRGNLHEALKTFEFDGCNRVVTYSEVGSHCDVFYAPIDCDCDVIDKGDVSRRCVEVKTYT